jgi:hypothetical protein
VAGEKLRDYGRATGGGPLQGCRDSLGKLSGRAGGVGVGVAVPPYRMQVTPGASLLRLNVLPVDEPIFRSPTRPGSSGQPPLLQIAGYSNIVFEIVALGFFRSGKSPQYALRGWAFTSIRVWG